VPSLWSEPLPILARGMAICDQTLFVAGPPDVFAYAPETATDRYHDTSAEALREEEAALAGKRGGKLLAVSPSDGSTLAQYPLDAPPEWDGLAAAGGRLYIVTSDGRVLCMKAAE
jgi:outer membrane protein assembly factor BamB